MRSDEIRLQDILEAIQQIEFFIATGQENFYQSKLLQSAVLYQLIIIGEAAKDVDLNLRNQYSKIPWEKVSGMRDILAHQYFRIDLDLVWLTVTNNLPALKEAVSQMLLNLANKSMDD